MCRGQGVEFLLMKVFQSCGCMSDEEPQLIAIDEEATHQSVQGERFGKATGAAHQPFDPGPQLDGLAGDFWRMRLATVRLLGGERPLVRPPAIGVKPGATQRL